MVRIINNKRGLYTIYIKYEVNIEISKAWDFFIKLKNIQYIMPEELNFNVTSGSSSNIYDGQIITFNTKILPFFKANIISEITKICQEKYFIDRQISGPYKIWHHEHHFQKTKNNTTIISEKIKYKLYFYPFSWIINKVFIKKKLINIFKYRIKKTKYILDKNSLNSL